jgi:biopolymer transport protein ExbB
MHALSDFWARSDGLTQALALLLLGMSVLSWVLIAWKAWLLKRARVDIARAVPAFWGAASLSEGRERIVALDREALLLPLLDAAQLAPAAATLEAQGPARAQRTRRLRDALHQGLAHLQQGQVWLASVGSTAPFVGLLGTVWGVYGALAGIADAGLGGIDAVSGPIGEALVMTAAGIAVAVPAVLGYNVFGQWVAACEAELEGFAHDLLAQFDEPSATPPP